MHNFRVGFFEAMKLQSGYLFVDLHSIFKFIESYSTLRHFRQRNYLNLLQNESFLSQIWNDFNGRSESYF